MLTFSLREDSDVNTGRVARLVRVGSIAVPWLAGAFLAMICLDLLDRDGVGPSLFVSIALAIVQAVALRWRHSSPVLVAAVVCAAGLPFHAIAPFVVLPVAPWLAMWALTIGRPPHVSLFGLAAVTGISAVSFATQPVEDPIFAMIVGFAIWAFAEASRNNRNAGRAEADRGIVEERAHLAREIHDVLAHSVSVIVVQAAAAVDVFDDRPDQAREALGVIEREARDALEELRRLLGRRVENGDGPAPPQPGIAGVDALAERMGSAGLEVVVRCEGESRALPVGVDLSAYRIVQEALTNTLRHARATRAVVNLRYEPSGIVLEVRDNGKAAPAAEAGDGRGLRGMRERARLVGGTLDAGPSRSGGYRVAARLPFEAG